MTEDEAFLRAILDAPDDDAPRLMYADWLDEHGDPRRAEFIRLQCRLAAMDECDPERPDLVDREWELLAVYRKRWRPAESSGLEKHIFRSDFLRGFFARVNVPADALLEHGEEWFGAYPLEELQVRDATGRMAEIAQQPWLARVSSLVLLHGVLTAEDLEALFASRHTGRLRRLTLLSVSLTPDMMQQLVAWPGLRRLRHLSLGNDYLGHEKRALLNDMGPDGIRLLLESPHLKGLTSLYLTTPLTEAEVALIGEAPQLASLTELRLIGCGITAAGAGVLGKAPGLAALRHLDVGWNSIGDDGNAALASSPMLARLDSLDLSWTELFGPRAAAALAASPHLGRLRRLDLTQSYVGPEAAEYLASARFGALNELRLFNDKIGPKGMIALARSPHLVGLTRLDLMGNEIGPKGAKALAGSRFLSNLRWLELAHNNLGPDGAKALAGSPVLSKLRHLSVWLSDIGAIGARALMLSPHLTALWSLDLQYSKFTDATAWMVAPKTTLAQLRRLILGDDRKLTDKGLRLMAASPRLPHLLQVQRGPLYGEHGSEVSDLVLKQDKGRELGEQGA
jgi:uncharacterized protein (TIGR02996 family)